MTELRLQNIEIANPEDSPGDAENLAVWRHCDILQEHFRRGALGFRLRADGIRQHFTNVVGTTGLVYFEIWG